MDQVFTYVGFRVGGLGYGPRFRCLQPTHGLMVEVGPISKWQIVTDTCGHSQPGQLGLVNSSREWTLFLCQGDPNSLHALGCMRIAEEVGVSWTQLHGLLPTQSSMFWSHGLSHRFTPSPCHWCSAKSPSFSVQNPCLEMSAARQMIGKKNCSTIRAFWMDACNPRAHLAEAPHSSQSRIPKDWFADTKLVWSPIIF